MKKFARNFLKRILKKLKIQISINKNLKEIPIPLTASRIDQICFFNSILGRIKNTDGVIVECGVGHGRSLLLLTSLNSSLGQKKIYAFDSFDGFPDPKEYEKNSIVGIKKGYYKSSLESVKVYLRDSGINNEEIDQINFVKGYFENTLIEFNQGISLLHIDVDLAESYKTVLNNLWDKVHKGGIIIFDEYKTKKWVTATQVIDDFVESKQLKIQEYKTKYFVKHFVIKG